MSDLFDTVNESYQRAQDFYPIFKSTYENIPGVMDISDDDWFGTSYYVSVDSKNYVEGSVPNNYNGVSVYFVQVYENLNSVKEAKKIIKNSNDDNKILAILQKKI